MIKGIIFDLDGVITSTSDQHFEAWKLLANKLGYSLPDSMEIILRGVSRLECVRIILQYFNLQSQYSLSEQQKLATLKNEYYLSLIANLSANDILPGISNFLLQLQDHHYFIALASVSRNAKLILKKLGLTHYFAYIVEIDQVIVPKPAPDIFLLAAKGLKLTPAEVVVIDDSPIGILAAKQANMLSIGINTIADISLESTEQLSLTVIEKLQNWGK